MKKAIIGASFLLFVSLIFISCSDEKVESKNIEQIYKEEGVPVKVEKVERKGFSKSTTYNTTLSGIKESNASAMIGGRIEKVLVKVGDYVKKDQVLFKFPADAPSAQYYQAKVAFENSQMMFDRYKKLFEVGGVSAQDFDNVKTQYEVNKANFETVSQMIDVISPISGFVTKISVRESDDVKKETLLATIADLSKLKASIQISEDEISDVKVGDKAVAEWQGMKIEGKVTQVDMAMNPMTQAFNADITFENRDGKIKPGVTVDIMLAGAESNNSIVVERKNLVKRGDDYFVYVLNDSSAQLRKVTLGKNSGLLSEINSGLNVGDLLITEGQINLEDNVKVKIIN
ncbi:MAG: efflux RND transporter periplasmic adaptor subunit [Ignavibacteriae bacterium]|nr:efflux RND transporter periplasmic adaptor subunit [Ignavibacteriota bacterium]